MKKNIFIKAVFLTLFAGLSFAEDAADKADITSDSGINIDQIAQELESEENLSEKQSDEEVIVEEEVFDAENEAETVEVPLPVKNDNYWRGKTAVAAENEFPKGIFAMAKGYYPGDSLTVYNSKTQKTVNVLIIGSIDQNDMVGIKFSQEAAREIKITDKTDANVILDERINPPEVRENAGAKLVIFGGDESDYSDFEQPVSISEDQVILTENAPEVADVIDEIAEELEASEEAGESGEESGNAPVQVSNAVESVLPDGVEILEDSSENSYAAIVLDVPQSVEEQAGVEEAVIENQATEEAESVSNPVEEENPAAETAVCKENNLSAAESSSSPVFESEKTFDKNNFKGKGSLPYKNLIANENMVRKGYYIQLAFLANEENLQKFIDNYGDELKLFLIPHKNGYKIFAGVFTDEDKSFALDYVKSLGFKDAFVRKLGR